jgi:hypothetical protein
MDCEYKRLQPVAWEPEEREQASSLLRLHNTNVARREPASSATRPRQPYRQLASPTDYVVLVDCPGGRNQVRLRKIICALCVLRTK